MKSEPLQEHQWLQQLVGEWTGEGEGTMGPDEPPHKFTMMESVRSIGGVWVQLEGRGAMPEGGDEAITQMTLGYDPQKKRYVGTWIGSMMTHLWQYEGELDAAGKVLTLNAEGPSIAGEGKLAQYRDVIAFESADHRILSSHILGDDGQWTRFMTAHYRRRG